MKARRVCQDAYRIDGLRTWIEVDRDAIRHNVAVFRSLLESRILLAGVVKSNAYGHDLVQYARELAKHGVDVLAVDSVIEAFVLRDSGMEIPILVLGHTLPINYADAARHDVAITVSSRDGLRALARLKLPRGTRLEVHLKIDTGMHRQGFLEHDRRFVRSALRDLPSHVAVRGAYTHFAEAKNPAFPAYTQDQLRHFRSWTEPLVEVYPDLVLHAAATSGTLLYPDSHLDLVRVGIGLYGLMPSLQAARATLGRVALRPTLSWYTRIGEVKRLPRGVSTGYDRTEVLRRDSRVAVCPVGYWHGLPRAHSSVGHVLVRGRRARILGRVSMDMIVVDVTDIRGVRMGDLVTLIGTDGPESITAEEFASLDGTVSYEVLTRLNPRIRRVFV